MKYEYAVQWHYKGENKWFTLTYRHTELELARRHSNLIRGHHNDIETRIVRRPKVDPWEVVE